MVRNYYLRKNWNFRRSLYLECFFRFKCFESLHRADLLINRPSLTFISTPWFLIWWLLVGCFELLRQLFDEFFFFLAFINKNLLQSHSHFYTFLYLFLLQHQRLHQFLFILSPSFLSMFLQNIFTSYILPLFAHACNKSSCPFLQNLFMLLRFKSIWKRVVIILIFMFRINVTIIVILRDGSFMLFILNRVHKNWFAIFVDLIINNNSIWFLTFFNHLTQPTHSTYQKYNSLR